MVYYHNPIDIVGHGLPSQPRPKMDRWKAQQVLQFPMHMGAA